MPARVVGPLAEQQILPAVEDGPRILERADDLLRAPSCRKCPSVARNALSRVSLAMVHLKPCSALSPTTSSSSGSEFVDGLLIFTSSPRYDDGRRQIVLDPLIAERHAAAEALFVPVAIAAIEERAAEPEADRRIEQIRFGEAGQIALHFGAGRRFEAQVLAAAAPGAAAHRSRPSSSGSASISKFCSSNRIWPTRPASEFTATPSMIRPVWPSLSTTSISTPGSTNGCENGS